MDLFASRGTFKLPRYSTIPTHRACVDLLWGNPPAAINSPCAVRLRSMLRHLYIHSSFALQLYSTWRRRLILGWFPETKWIRGCWFLDGRLSPLSEVPTLMARLLARSLPPTICASVKQIIPVIGWPLILCTTSGGT